MTTPAGWYPDPNDARFERYWDGRAWTEHVDMIDTPTAEPVTETRAPMFPQRPTAATPATPTPTPQPVAPVLAPQPAAPTPPAPVPQSDVGRPVWKKKRVLIPAGVFGLFAVAAAVAPPEEDDLIVGPDTTAVAAEEAAGPTVETTATTSTLPELRIEVPDTLDAEGREAFSASLRLPVDSPDCDVVNPDLRDQGVTATNSDGDSIDGSDGWISHAMDISLDDDDVPGMCVARVLIGGFVDQLTNELTVTVGGEDYDLTIEELFISKFDQGEYYVLGVGDSRDIPPPTTTTTAELGSLENPAQFVTDVMTVTSNRGGVWIVRPLGVDRDLAQDRFDDLTADQECLAVVYDVEVSAVEDGELVSSEFDTPRPSLIVDGVVVDSGTDCFDAPRATGALWYLDVSLAPGGNQTTFATFVVPIGATISHVIFDDLAFAAP